MCGIVGIIGPKDRVEGQSWASFEVYRALLTLQHRGQDASGILSYGHNSEKFYQHKDLGLVSQVMTKPVLKKLRGSMAIGHTRYATMGSDEREDLQPLVTGIPFGVGMVHNGNILNYSSLAKTLRKKFKMQLLTGNDLEIIMHYWCYFLMQGGIDDELNFKVMTKAAENIFKTVNGAYAVVGLMAGKGLFGFRDPNGIRPLVLGRQMVTENKKKDGYKYCLTSETNALNFLGYEFVRDIEPGELIFIDSDGHMQNIVITIAGVKKAPCMFEWVYFAGAESTFEGKSIYAARLNLGRILAKKSQKLITDGIINPEIVCPVPDTSRTASISLAEELRLPYREGLIKNRYIHRSFILNDQEKREKAVELKLSPVKSEIEGKKILLVDDSVVRGTTSRQIIMLLKRYGASDITLAITCPPIRYSCYYGIDFPSSHELIAGERTVDEFADWVGANKVIFLEEADIKEAIGLQNLCLGCINNSYPTCVAEGQEFAAKRRALREGPA